MKSFFDVVFILTVKGDANERTHSKMGPDAFENLGGGGA